MFPEASFVEDDIQLEPADAVVSCTGVVPEAIKLPVSRLRRRNRSRPMHSQKLTRGLEQPGVLRIVAVGQVGE